MPRPSPSHSIISPRRNGIFLMPALVDRAERLGVDHDVVLVGARIATAQVWRRASSRLRSRPARRMRAGPARRAAHSIAPWSRHCSASLTAEARRTSEESARAEIPGCDRRPACRASIDHSEHPCCSSIDVVPARSPRRYGCLAIDECFEGCRSVRSVTDRTTSARSSRGVECEFDFECASGFVYDGCHGECMPDVPRPH